MNSTLIWASHSSLCLVIPALSSAFLQNSVPLFFAARTTKSRDIGKGTSSFSSQLSLFSPSLPLRHWHVMFPVFLLPFLVFFLLFSLGAFSSSEQTLQCIAICTAVRSDALSLHQIEKTTLPLFKSPSVRPPETWIYSLSLCWKVNSEFFKRNCFFQFSADYNKNINSRCVMPGFLSR